MGRVGVGVGVGEIAPASDGISCEESGAARTPSPSPHQMANASSRSLAPPSTLLSLLLLRALMPASSPHKGSHSDELAAASRLEDTVNFYQTASPDVAKLFHIDPESKRPAVVLLKKEEEKVTIYDGEFRASAIAEFVSENKLPLITTLTQENAPAIFESQIKKQTASPDVAKLFHIDPESKRPAVVLLKKEEEKVTIYDGEFRASAIAEFVSASKLPLITTLTQEKSPAIFESQIKKQIDLNVGDLEILRKDCIDIGYNQGLLKFGPASVEGNTQITHFPAEPETKVQVIEVSVESKDKFINSIGNENYPPASSHKDVTKKSSTSINLCSSGILLLILAILLLPTVEATIEKPYFCRDPDLLSRTINGICIVPEPTQMCCDILVSSFDNCLCQVLNDGTLDIFLKNYISCGGTNPDPVENLKHCLALLPSKKPKEVILPRKPKSSFAYWLLGMIALVLIVWIVIFCARKWKQIKAGTSSDSTEDTDSSDMDTELSETGSTADIESGHSRTKPKRKNANEEIRNQDLEIPIEERAPLFGPMTRGRFNALKN